MLDEINRISVAADFPDFAHLTFPDCEYRENSRVMADRAKGCLDAFFKRLKRVSPGAAGLWRLEWMPRKTGVHVGKLMPHFHLLVWGLAVRERGVNEFGQMRHETIVAAEDYQLKLQFADLSAAALAGVPFPTRKQVFRVDDALYQVQDWDFFKPGHRGRAMTFWDWCAMSWYDVVQSGDVNHFFAGTRVEHLESWGGVMHYCAKYIGKVGENDLSQVEGGRVWGVFNRSMVPWAKMIELDLDEETGVRLRRIARHYLSRKLGRPVIPRYGITIYCDTAVFRSLLCPRDPF
jgi:hypothetical protein